MLRNLGWCGVVACTALTGSVGACTLILGDDYQVSGADGAGATGGAGGAGGQAQGGGGASVVPYACGWDPTRFVTLRDLSPEPAGSRLFNGNLFAVAVDGGVRAFTSRNDATNFGQVEVYSYDGWQVRSFSRRADRLLDVQRLAVQQIGVLFALATAGVPLIATELLVVPDSDPDGVDATIRALGSQPNTDSLGNGTFTTVGGALTDVDYVVQAADATGDKVLFGRYRGTPDDPLAFTEYDASLGQDAFKPTVVVRNGAQTHVFLGELSGQFPARQYVLPDGLAPAPMLATLEYPIEYYPFAIAPRPGGNAFNVGAAYLSTDGSGTLRLHTGPVPAAELASYDLSLLPAAVTFASFADVPSQGGPPSWHGPNLFLVGSYANAKTTLGIVIAHETGVERTNQEVPFPQAITAVSIDSAAVAPNPGFASLGGDLHLVWTERYVAGGNDYHLLRAGVLQCFPP
ncbi:MAG: hypothetical protein HY908_32390 [Myxococcales bacterium]|nr:hypothetical protein [Myxococcales bacterium]